jgi:hypothetical protein
LAKSVSRRSYNWHTSRYVHDIHTMRIITFY